MLDVRTIADRKVWNDLVQSFSDADFRQGFEWSEQRREQGWSVRRLAVLDGDECVAAAAVQSRALPWAGCIMYASRGPLWRRERPDVLTALLDALGAMARQTRGVFLRISPGIAAGDSAAGALLQKLGFRPLPDTWTVWNAPRHIQVLDVRGDEAQLLAAVRERYRRYIRSAGRRDIVVEEAASDEDVAAFHRLMVNLGRLKHFPVRDVGHYRSLIARYGRHGGVLLLIARRGGDAVGGLLAFPFGRRLFVQASSVRTDDGGMHGVAPVLFWEAIRRAKRAGAELVDFGSSAVRQEPDPSHPNYGLFQFKAGLGCRLIPLQPFHDLVFRPLAYRAFRRAETRLLPRVHRVLAEAPWLVRVLKKAV